ncbi:uncharacterized protein BT62DRAFT_1074755 [Guyanagaster necrorhizus]|uniref:Uncharacterized protein n=1 Tax=Guyanagaster necrorhizus TaxID=856835 RepID=A0A9P8AUP1_9AGAR|nr:uncharacterized protein BT62DRAFT_1074755 [Guyanagaster necrorhizus MCA 3950]KAG7448266.1 hypothetical protein BT62DRAFT_1074755 [Guyanagaster necrorhizus MCA 3950]
MYRSSFCYKISTGSLFSLWDHLSTSICAVSGVDIKPTALSSIGPRNRLRLEGKQTPRYLMYLQYNLRAMFLTSPLFRTDGSGAPYLFSGFPLTGSKYWPHPVCGLLCSSPNAANLPEVIALPWWTPVSAIQKSWTHRSHTAVSGANFIHESVFSFITCDEHRVHCKVDSVNAVHLDAVKILKEFLLSDKDSTELLRVTKTDSLKLLMHMRYFTGYATLWNIIVYPIDLPLEFEDGLRILVMNFSHWRSRQRIFRHRRANNHMWGYAISAAYLYMTPCFFLGY